MPNEIQDVIDQIVILQKAITPPTGEKDIARAHDEEPQSIGALPAFVNVVNDGEIDRGVSLRSINPIIEMILLFAPSGEKYSDRSRRAWFQAVLDKFDDNVTIGGTAAQAHIDRFSFDDPFPLSGTTYLATRFYLRVQMQPRAIVYSG